MSLEPGVQQKQLDYSPKISAGGPLGTEERNEETARLLSRAVRLGSYGDQILDAFVGAGSDAGNVDDIFSADEWTVLFAVGDYFLRGRRADAWEGIQFSCGGS